VIARCSPCSTRIVGQSLASLTPPSLSGLFWSVAMWLVPCGASLRQPLVFDRVLRTAQFGSFGQWRSTCLLLCWGGCATASLVLLASDMSNENVGYSHYYTRHHKFCVFIIMSLLCHCTGIVVVLTWSISFMVMCL
jgi:hypothetical protein